jgi:hypothetical protein
MEELFQIVGVIAFIAFSLLGSRKDKKKQSTTPDMPQKRDNGERQLSPTPRKQPVGGLRGLLESVVNELSEAAEVKPKAVKKYEAKPQKKVIKNRRVETPNEVSKKTVSKPMKRKISIKPSSIRNAIIMKEILDSPISLR